MDNSRSSTVTGVLRLVFAFAGILAAVIANNSLAQAPTQFAIRILSSPSYAVTGGDALVEADEVADDFCVTARQRRSGGSARREGDDECDADRHHQPCAHRPSSRIVLEAR